MWTLGYVRISCHSKWTKIGVRNYTFKPYCVSLRPSLPALPFRVQLLPLEGAVIHRFFPLQLDCLDCVCIFSMHILSSSICDDALTLITAAYENIENIAQAWTVLDCDKLLVSSWNEILWIFFFLDHSQKKRKIILKFPPWLKRIVTKFYIQTL